MRIFIVLLGLLLLQSCVKEENIKSVIKKTTFKDQNIKVIHDDFSQLVYDSIIVWKSNHELSHDKIDIIWNAMITELSHTLEISKGDVISKFNSVDITNSNYVKIVDEKYDRINNDYKSFITDLNIFKRIRARLKIITHIFSLFSYLQYYRFYYKFVRSHMRLK